MNDDSKQVRLVPTSEESDSDNPLLFWVAYVPMPQADGSEKKNYLSDGNGNLRMYKTEQKLREYLVENTTPEFYEKIVVHSVQGQIVVPDDGTVPHFHPTQAGLKPIPLSMPVVPIRHFDPNVAPPTALEQLNELEKRTKKRRRRS